MVKRICLFLSILAVGAGISRAQLAITEAMSSASTNADQFRAWWNLSPSVQVVVFVGNGLGSGGDGIRLWGPGAVNDADVVDSVDFLEALRGSTFTYDPATGAFGIF